MPVSQFNNTLKFLADVSSISYQPHNSRPPIIEHSGSKLEYQLDKSTNFYAHYENEDMILVAIHGVNDGTTLITAIINGFLTPNQEIGEVRNFCRKYEELIKETKRVFLIGHSLGAFAIVQCSRNHSKKLKSFLFSPYVPSSSGAYNRTIGEEPNFKKILYNNDWIANKLLISKGNLRDTLVFQPKSRGFMNTHGIINYQKSPDTINQDFKLYRK